MLNFGSKIEAKMLPKSHQKLHCFLGSILERLWLQK